MKISNLDSKTISWLKAYLLFLIILGHMMPQTQGLDVAEFPIYSVEGITNVIAIAISYVIAPAAVLVYFLVSGFLFWNGIDSWNWATYRKKIKSRSISLLQPYIIWNILSILTFVLFIFIKDFHSGSYFANIVAYLKSIGIHGFWDYKYWGDNKVDWLGNPTPASGPFVVPLWFVRDLIVASVISPLIYWFIKKLKIYFILALFLCYISRIWPQVPGFTIDSIFYFSCGMYLAVMGQSLTNEISKYNTLLTTLTIITFVICVYYGGRGTDKGWYIFPFFTICCVGSIVNYAAHLVKTNKAKIIPLIAQSSFFVYVLHACPIAYFSTIIGAIDKQTFALTSALHLPWLVYYFVSPVFVASFCIAVYSLLTRFCPSVAACLSGGRNNKPTQKQA